MNRTALLLGFVFFVTGCATTGSTAFYPLDELQALDTPEDRAEVLARALEVAPSKRNDAWRGVVSRAAIATLGEVEVSDAASAEQALALTESQPARFPFLARDAQWLGKRADLGVKALPYVSQQQRDRGAWQGRIYDFAKADAVTKGLAQRLAEEVLLKQLIPSTAMHLFELAFERDGAEVCKSATMVKVAADLAADGAAFKPAFEKCWPELVVPLTEAAKKSETRTAKLRLCEAMAAHAQEPAVKAVCAE